MFPNWTGWKTVKLILSILTACAGAITSASLPAAPATVLEAGTVATTILGILTSIVVVLSGTAAGPAMANSVEKAARVPPLAVLMILGCLFGASGCMVAIPQPGQTPAQVQACSSDATVHNIAAWSAGVLAAGGTTEASIAAADSNPTVQKDLAITGIATAALAGVATLTAETEANAYNSQGCGPALPLLAPGKTASR